MDVLDHMETKMSQEVGELFIYLCITEFYLAAAFG
jgi:hypothetical protein